MSVVIVSNDLESSQNVLCCDICASIFLLALNYFRFFTAVTHYSTVSHSSDNVTISGNFTNCCVITNTPNYQSNPSILEIHLSSASQSLLSASSCEIWSYLLSSLVIVKTSLSSNRSQRTNWPNARYSLEWTTKQEIFSFSTLEEKQIFSFSTLEEKR